MARHSHEEAATDTHKIGRELFALALLFWAAFLLLGVATYDPADPSFNQVVSHGHQVANGAGLVGAYLGGLLVEFFGLGAFLWFVGFALFGLHLFIRHLEMPWWRWTGFTLFSICATALAASEWMAAHAAVDAVRGGGFVGTLLFSLAQYYFSATGAALMWSFLLLCAVQLMSGATWGYIGKKIGRMLLDLWLKHKERLVKRLRRKQDQASKPASAPESSPNTSTDASSEGGLDAKLLRSRAKKAKDASLPAADSHAAADDDAAYENPDPLVPIASASPDGDGGAPRTAKAPGQRRGGAVMPTMALLEPVDAQLDKTPDEVLRDRAQKLTECLADFGVQGEVQSYTPGPVVTMFEIKPAPGVKISRIAGLSDDLALALKALAVRIEAPIPGKDMVGVEIPNEVRQTVHLREILDSPAFKKADGPLPLALGKDIAGKPVVTDLSRMPHLLVAGATGQGKSVCLNSLLMSFLYTSKPEQVKLLLIDPKRIEFAVYADLPHLVHPVVTEMSQAKSALDWAVHEMDTRYEAMAKLGVRNILSYNEKLATLGDERTPELAELEHMPYLVLIIDELADLMLTGTKEVEISIVRLAQLARAAGIHMILATQRPSVDVVTGLIKANFPCRISFQVSSKHDSRTILDTVGAEYLLGKGDMLFKPSGGKIRRLHGCFVSDADVVSVVDYWKRQQPPSYRLDFATWGSDNGDGNGFGGEAGAMDSDQLYQDAVEFVVSQGKTSISMLQRRFRIGFNRAARFIEQMELDGIIGPADGSKPRVVIKGMD
ncbi:MAG: DNA translocase FtsK [Desulfovibrionaceae bacterium]